MAVIMKNNTVLSSIGLFLVLAGLFALAYNQAPLYTSNQNQYFLHGFAGAGYGTLSEDWLARTADPTPVFSLLVAGTMLLFRTPAAFYIYYALLMGVYLYSLVGIAQEVFPALRSRSARAAFIAVVILLHSAALRYVLLRLFEGDWPYLLEGGVAGQRLLGPVFQPSTFGVFLLLSLLLYLRGKPAPAVLAAVLAATMHPTYLLSAAALTLAYCADMLRSERRPWPAVRLGLLALAVVAPILLYTALTFGGGRPDVVAQARDILVNFRIPHHAIVAAWFNATVLVKLGFAGIALLLVRRSRLLILLGVPLAVAVLLTLLQVFIKNDMLALIFPWRLSTWLVPVSVVLILGKLASLAFAHPSPGWERLANAAGLALIGLAVAAGIVRTALDLEQAAGSSERPVEAYVAAHRLAGHEYLVPKNIFDFRLMSGAPSYGDFLSIPYRDSDVVEWYHRYLGVNRFYDKADCGMLEEFGQKGVTDVILPSGFPVQCPQLTLIHEDEFYGVYSLSPR
jgi:hypothetical protein